LEERTGVGKSEARKGERIFSLNSFLPDYNRRMLNFEYNSHSTFTFKATTTTLEEEKKF